jgi:CheY-like chemotaxis protein
VLVVEDDEEIGELARRTPEKNGYVVCESRSVGEALEVFERWEGDLDPVFADVVLPDGRAEELVDRLLAPRPGLKVVLSSGYAAQLQ